MFLSMKIWYRKDKDMSNWVDVKVFGTILLHFNAL